MADTLGHNACMAADDLDELRLGDLPDVAAMTVSVSTVHILEGA